MEHKNFTTLKRLAVSLVAVALFGAATANAQEAKLKNTQGAQSQNDKAAKASQDKISSVAETTKTMVDEYRATLRKIENTKQYNEQMKKLIASQDEEMVSMKAQIEEIKNTNQEIFPLMASMTSNLKEFIKLDLPFLPEERQRRLKQIDDTMDKAKVSTSEKFRRVVEAYQIENEYGRTIESYKGIQNVNGKDLTVDFLRVGRVALVYQTLDGKESGQWDNEAKKWVPVSSSYRKSISKGIKMANKQSAPNLITLPLPAPQEVQVESI